MDWTRGSIEKLKGWDRPRVRCKYECQTVDQDGRRTTVVRETTGEVVPDGNNPWVVLHVGGKWVEERFSWELVLAVLNDRFEPPLWFWDRYGVVYEV